MMLYFLKEFEKAKLKLWCDLGQMMDFSVRVSPDLSARETSLTGTAFRPTFPLFT